jgi:uncharacterized membrane protein YgdD (TMEM256/DUF423 family)
VLYHLAHAVALVALALSGTMNRGACYLLLAGVLIFSGSLYVLAITNVRWLGRSRRSAGFASSRAGRG